MYLYFTVFFIFYFFVVLVMSFMSWINLNKLYSHYEIVLFSEILGDFNLLIVGSTGSFMVNCYLLIL